MRIYRWLSASVGRHVGLATLFAGMALFLDAYGAAAQTCAAGPVFVDGTSCTVTAGSSITVSQAAVPGLDARNAGATITAQGITVQLGPGVVPRTFVGAQALSGAAVELSGSTIITSQAGTGQRGVISDGFGSNISATGLTITLGTGATTVNDNLAVLAQNGGMANFTNSAISTRGAANGIANHAVTATGSGSTVTLTGGTVSTASRGSFGVQAADGGRVVIGGGTQVTTTGVQDLTTTPVTGSHALIATGSGSRIDGANVTLGTSGLFASAARAENGGVVALTGATINTSSNSQADSDPSSATRVLSGGSLRLTNSTVDTTGQRGNGLSVQDAGSTATVTGTAISVSGTRANAAFVFDGGEASFSDSSLFSANSTAVNVQGAGSSIDLTDSNVRSGGAIGYGLRVGDGGTVTMTGGSSTTTGRDAPALAAGNATVVANNVTFSTAGPDNAMGVLADLGGNITLNGGSIVTTGDSVRLSAYPHGIAARNPGGIVRANGTSVRTEGLTAMGVVADDGGVILLDRNSITTLGTTSIGLYSTVEQSGPQFPAGIVGERLVVETFGTGAHGAMAVEHFLPADSTILLDDSLLTTHGDLASGLRSIMSASIDARNSVILTQGDRSSGLHSRDNGSEINLIDTTVTTEGTASHGALAEGGGLVNGLRTSVEAKGSDSYALYVAGAAGFVSEARFDASRLSNADGPAIAIGGEGVVSLTGSVVSSSGQWLSVGTIADFQPLTVPDAGLGGVTDPEGLETSPVFTPPAALPVVPGLANVTLSRSVVTGAAFTAPGSVSNLVLEDDSLWNMTGSSNLTTLLNDPSLIQFSAPTGDPTLLASYMTLTVVDYVGEDGNIGLNTYLDTDGSPSDRLVIDGGSATGSSGLIISNTTGGGALTTGNGILVVDAINGGVTDPTAFYLAAPAAAGPYDYLLFRSSVDGSGSENWYLRSELDGPPDPTPIYRPEVSLYAAIPSMAAIYGRHIIDTLHERVGEEEQLKGRTDIREDENFNGVWLRGIGQWGHRDGDARGVYDGAPEFDYRFGAMQGGMDFYREEEDGITDHAGMYLAYGHGRMDVTQNLVTTERDAGDSDFNAFSVGGYWTRFGENGWYLDGVLQATWYDVTTHSNRPTQIGFPDQSIDGFGFAASLEGGYPFDLGDGWQFEPQAQIIWQTIRMDDFNDGAADVRYDNLNSLVGRIGARVARTWQAEEATATDPARLATVWGRVNVWHEFTAKAQTEVSSSDGFVPFSSNLDETWIELGLGATRQVSNNTSLYGNVNFSTSFDGDNYAWNGKLGLRVNW
ncbi:outer membrane autotransporter protein [Rhizobium leguminosarum]|uniref:autotransporter outer membrane beta-barrel domain-containing protein n=1 Tax=Rhizobium leguminosarum TaxID=384 RepID=UPI00160F7A64|nr:autotransporter outer membrane beta-barrel domain-containing protein [Rhizobium leguminosarum]MBB4389393.1 outer membrane autotransporter protein [Rhizobium leguminosarum]